MSNQISPSSGAQLGTDEDCSFGLVDHRVAFMDGMDALFSNPDFSDVTFVVKEERFHVHKIILATRSEYFRTMLYGGLKESTQAEIFLKETDPIAFRTLLRYIYTAKVDLSGFAVNELMTILQLAHEYMLTEIEKALASHTKTKLDTDNVFAVIRTSTLLSVDDLTEHCMHYCDRHAPQILAAQEFLGLPLEVVMEMLSRDSFCVAEIDVFYAVTKWIQARRFAENTDVGMLIERFIADDCLRLPLISQKELLSAVRGAMAFATISSVLDKHILNAIQLKDSGSYSRFRGRLLPNENIATIDLGAKFVAGGDSQMLHRGSRS
ncbi:unnamed protein product [Heligmosomoides polygyrus]|uniref:BTB domain-containing protein n=1 Tax=Heligmosomoides polygyrus TaxID=6339 RepID=A0A3P7YJ45_HELPZ|nr:unnamed protein product [Heligmosomoides polygyrus]